MKKAAKPSRIAVAHAATSRIRRRTRKSARLDQIDISQAQSSSEPSCEDQTAASR